MKRILELSPTEAPPLEEPDEGAFDAHAHALTLRNIQAALLLILVGSLLAALVDRFNHAHAPEVIQELLRLHAFHAGTAAVAYLSLRRAAVARRLFLVTLVVVGLDSAAIGYVTGLLGDLGTPWFHFTYLGAIGLVIPVVALPERALCGAVFSSSLLLGLGWARPLLPAHPLLPTTITFLIFSTAWSGFIGHVIYVLVRRAFLASRARARAAVEIDDLNRGLARRVRHQTRDLSRLAAHLESAREDERARIARELHDELGQELAALRYTLTFLRRRFERDPGSIRGNLDELDLLLARSATTTRQILSDLRPRVLDDLGLDAGVEWLLKRTEERAGLSCQLTTSSRKLELDVDVSVATFRILQESLTNVVKHARATRVEVDLEVRGGELRVSVHDDGIGMRYEPLSEPAPGAGGMGIIGMRERAEGLGGGLDVESAPGEGTTIRVHLPTTVPHKLAESKP